MPQLSKREALIVNEEELSTLKKMASSQTLPTREVKRARVLVGYINRLGIRKICEDAGLSHRAAYKCIDKALGMGWEAGLRDLYHCPKASGITLEAKSWVIHLACTQPKELGYAAEVWSRQLLADHVRKHAQDAGHPCLNKAAKATIQRLLSEHALQPHKVKYYLEKRDPEFVCKMREVLFVYKEVELYNKAANDKQASLCTVCVDEKPGVQAIANTAPDLPPVPGKYEAIARDHEYKRMGTASILAGIDLHSGHVFAQVHRRHRSREFIELLKEMDSYYPPEVKIRLILDNHSSHISKETRAYLATRPGRFIYVHTPRHGSWLNLAETLFGKMARTFLRNIRVTSWEELKKRILLGVNEINNSPVVHKWNKFDPLFA